MDPKVLELIQEILAGIGAITVPLLTAFKVHARLKRKAAELERQQKEQEQQERESRRRPELQLADDYGQMFDRQELRIAALELMTTQAIEAKQLCEDRADIALRAHMDERFKMQRHIDSLETKLAIMAARIASIDDKKNGGNGEKKNGGV